MRKSLIFAGLAVSVLALSGCALGSTDSPEPTAGTATSGELAGANVTVGSKEFTEQLILCEITAQRLEAQGATVKRICGMTGSATVRDAEVSGDIDTYWEYTGTGWISYLKHTEPIQNEEEQYTTVRDEDLAQNQIAWLPPAEANNTYAVAVKTETAKELGVTTLSEYAELSQSNPAEATFCGASEFFGRNDGWPGLVEAYGISLPDSGVATLAEGPIYDAVGKGDPCKFGEVFATDGRIAALGLTVLEDDKSFFPYYNLSLTVRQEILDKHPAISETMAPVTELLTTQTLQDLNAQVDVDGKTPVAVASAWLSENNLN